MSHYNYKKFVVFLLCFMSLAIELKAQKFEASAVFGLNAAQIDGDNNGGFNKLGFTGGIKTIYNFEDGWGGGIELLYSQRGSRSELTIGTSGAQFKIHLNYIEIPVYGVYRLLFDDEREYYVLSFHIGMSYARLLNVSLSDDSQFDSREERFKDNDLSYIFGASYSTSPGITFTGRFTRAFTYLFKDPISGPAGDALNGFFLTFRIAYNF